MIFLMGEIVLYLVAALLLGIGTGWLLRDVRARLALNPADRLPGIPQALAAEDLAGSGRSAALEREIADLKSQVRKFETQSAAGAAEIETLLRRLSGAERQVQELERERALQHRALQVLHQQLELAVERRAPERTRATGTTG